MYLNSAPLTMSFPAKAGAYHDEPAVLSIIYTNRNTPVIQTAIASAFIRNMEWACDYCTSCLTTFTDACSKVQPEDMARSFEASIPGILKRLFGKGLWHFEKGTNNCNNITATSDVMELKTSSKKLFAVISLTADEAVLQLKRKHFDITVSLLLAKPRSTSTQKNVVLSQAITCHTSLGRFCFTLLRPFFQNAMPALLKQTVQNVAA